jgi:hypothetical protein
MDKTGVCGLKKENETATFCRSHVASFSGDFG